MSFEEEGRRNALCTAIEPLVSPIVYGLGRALALPRYEKVLFTVEEIEGQQDRAGVGYKRCR